MNFGWFYLAGAAFLAVCGLTTPWLWWLVWPVVSLLLVASGYFGAGPGVFGKRRDGRIPWYRRALVVWYLAGFWLVRRALHRYDTANVCDEVVPGLWVGRRPKASELPGEVEVLVDLTAALPRALPEADVEHVTFPIVDGFVPDATAVNALADSLAAKDNVYIYCGMGRARSAMVAVLVLLARGEADSAEQALALVRRARPAAQPMARQWRFLTELTRR